MTRFPRNLLAPRGIRGKLVLLTVGTLLLAVFMIFTLFIYQQQRLLRVEWTQSLGAQARLLATSSQAAIAFMDRQEANRLLGSVQSNPAVLHARLLTPEGETFAQFTRAGHDGSVMATGLSGLEGYRIDPETLTVWASSPSEFALPATVALVVSREEMHAAFRRTTLEAVAGLVIALALVLWLSSRVVRHLSAPVEDLSTLMRRFAEDATLTERAHHTGDDEIAQLCKGFNALVDSLQARDRELAGYRANLEDLVRQRTHDLNLAIDESRRANRAKSDFLARMSHEIRTPMNAIIGLGRLLLKTRLDLRQRDYQEKVLAASDALLGVINDVLDYSRIEAGKLSLESIPFDINQVVRNLIGVVALKAQEKGLELLIHIEPDVPRWVVGDPLRLGQVLVNLINNAIKFTDQGEIIMRARQIGDADGRTLVEFTVRDTGMGIPLERQKDLFNPFTQVDDSITRRFGGTGLGLAICKQICELMGGSINVESTPGKGSLFRFHVSLGKVLEHPPTPLHSHLLAARHVLLVDDNESARLVLGEMLSAFDLNVDICASGAEALERLRDAPQPYDLILLDWLMPGIDGIETARRIQARSLGQDTPPPAILMITAGSYESVVDRIAGVGIRQVLAKPVSESTLYDGLIEVILGSAVADAQRRQRREDRAGHIDMTPIRGARVLLVDDVEMNLELALELLRDAGMRADVARNGREAVDMARAGDYALILMDIQMPDMDGLSATREIRADPRLHDLPIIAMTAHAMSGDRERSLEAGMNDHLTKPIDEEKLRAALLRWIPSAAACPEAAPSAAPSEHGEHEIPILEGIDTARGLANHMRRPALYRRMLAGFNREFGMAAEDIADAIATADYTLARRLAHSVKSAAATLGADELSYRARVLEEHYASGMASATDYNFFVAALKRVERVLRPLAQEWMEPDATPEPREYQAALAIIERIETQLREDDARAEGTLADLEACLPGPSWREPLRTLRDLIEDIEYEAARARLPELRQAIQTASRLDEDEAP
jgi:signal transduction histidine kinase/DNA-binding response OmpR family regulator/HPt (histidine-containing phosphotransfer) domain-containing protein